MKILITSGGTSEAIDQVRSITNHASGHLGKIIAELALDRGHEVTLVTAKQAVKPSKHANLHIITITNVDNLQVTLEPLVRSHHVFIHSMAVSDYTPVYMTDLVELEQTKNITELLQKRNTENKISSKEEYQVLFLKKTPKVVSFIKKWNPDILLVGFKLLVNVSKDELFAVAHESLQRNNADYIVANDLTDISDKEHVAYLISSSDTIQARNKTEIAQLILNTVEKGE